VDNVLGLARTGLIFTGIQEGAQLGRLTQPQPGQTEPGIPYHVPSGWVPVGGGAQQELSRGSGGHSGGAVRERGSVVWSVLSCFLLICIVVTVPFVCCSVKLPLSRPTSFLPVYFHSPPHCGGERGSRVALLLPAADETKRDIPIILFIIIIIIIISYVRKYPIYQMVMRPQENNITYHKS